MQFKTDENLPVDVAEALRDASFDALTIHDQEMVGNPDPQVAAVCQTEKRALVTLDLDFSDIRTYPPKDYSGIIVLRPRDQAKPTVLSLISQLIPLLAVEPLEKLVDSSRDRTTDTRRIVIRRLTKIDYERSSEWLVESTRPEWTRIALCRVTSAA